MRNHMMNQGKHIAGLALFLGLFSTSTWADKYDDIVERMSAESIERQATETTEEATTPTPTTDKKLFRVVDENGKVSFTDVKPENAESSDVPISSYSKTNVIDSKRASLQQYEDEVDARIKARQKAQEEYENRVKQAEERLNLELKRQAEGKEPRMDEWQKTRKGRFLKKSYRDRQQVLQDNVDKAAENVKNVRQESP